MNQREKDRREIDRRVPRRGVNIRHDDEHPRMKRFGYKDLTDIICENCGKKFSAFKENAPKEQICWYCSKDKPVPNSLTKWLINEQIQDDPA